jgi:predicted AAA+ superfamily ATPase
VKARVLGEYLRRKGESGLWRIVVLTGSRQTGKTTLAGRCFPGYADISLDNPTERGIYADLTAAQWKEWYPKAIVDEVQKEPSLIESVKSVYDRYADVRYVLLGSSQFLLMKQVRESLAGRCLIIELYPLILPEALTRSFDDPVRPSFFIRLMKGDADTAELGPFFSLDGDYAVKLGAFEFYLRWGGYPALSDESLSDEERYEILDMYVRTFLERDIRDLSSFRDLEPFVKLQRYLANNTGCLVNYASIAKETGVSIPTVQRYCLYMEMSFQVAVLPAWAANPLKRLVKAPKIHFLDHGVLKAILKKTGSPTGNEFESAVIAEIYKQIKTCRLPLSCYHVRTHDGMEIDLLLEGEDFFIAIEVKQSVHIDYRDTRGFRGLRDFLPKPLKYCFILSNDMRTHVFDGGIIALHAAYFLC